MINYVNDIFEEDIPPRKKLFSKERLWSSLVIAIIFLFLLLPSIDNLPIFFDYTFVALVLSIFIYGLFEISNFVFRNKPLERNKIFAILILSFGSTFLWAEINYIFFSHEFSNILIFLSIDLILILIFYSINTEIEFQDLLTIVMISILFFLYLISISILSLNEGWQTFLLFTSIIFTSDIMSYYGGKKFGKTPFLPEVSPKKTVEGFFFGIVFSLIIGLFFFFAIFLTTYNGTIYGYSGKSLFLFLLIIPICSIVSPLGDLFFSRIKRHYNKKDFSNLIPGHGGLFDRIDSHIFASIISTALLLIIYY